MKPEYFCIICCSVFETKPKMCDVCKNERLHLIKSMSGSDRGEVTYEA